MKYFDANGEEYKVGDIVFNPFFGDYWVVQELTEQEKDDYGLETNLCLALYNDKDYYCTEIDSPVGFVIVMSKDVDEYAGVIEEMKIYLEQRNKEMEDDNGNKK